jgi:hypothetical protein
MILAKEKRPVKKITRRFWFTEAEGIDTSAHGFGGR